MPNRLPLILASQSPRRVQLLQEAGVVFEQRSPPFADPDQPPAHLGGDQAEQYAAALAKQKASSLQADISGSAVVLAADTICVDAMDRLVGKPRDRADAESMLRAFVNRTHRVITGVSLLGPERQYAELFSDTATVCFGGITDQQLSAYLAGEDWRGKAGGYNLFDRQADGWPITVTGDPTTVVGLPMRRLMPLLGPWVHSVG